MKSFTHTLESIYLCIRYPFLYPRNRWTGKHWNSWKIRKYLYGTYKQVERYDEELKRFMYDKSIHIEGIIDKAWKMVDDPTDENRFKQKKVILSYPYTIWFYIVKFVYEWILPIFHCIPTYTEWDAVPKGWKDAFGAQYLKDLKKQLKKDKILHSWRITDIKEKFGSLQLGCNYGSPELYQLINKYEDLSRHICIRCGKPATKMTGGWICPYCDDCFDDDKIPYMVRDAENNGEWVYTEDNDI